MSQAFVDLIVRYRQSGVIVDTEILLLYFVGRFSPDQITRFKRTDSFSADDYKLLSMLLGRFDRLLTTPHILAEVSNFSGQMGEPLRSLFFEKLQGEISFYMKNMSVAPKLHDVSSSFYGNWKTANTGIATVDFFGNHTGVSAGSTTSNTSGYIPGNIAPPACPKLLKQASGVDNVTTPSQHTYPSPPLTGCRVSVPFDGVVNTTTGKKHQAQDTVGSGIKVGTPVYAPEAGTITNFVTGKPHDPRPTSQCAGQNSPADFIEIRSDSDQALTRLYHVTILPNLATVGTHVTGGQQIGTIDLSGCTSAAHTHIQRKVGGVLVNFTTPCDNSHFDDPGTYYDDSDGTW